MRELDKIMDRLEWVIGRKVDPYVLVMDKFRKSCPKAHRARLCLDAKSLRELDEFKARRRKEKELVWKEIFAWRDAFVKMPVFANIFKCKLPRDMSHVLLYEGEWGIGGGSNREVCCSSSLSLARDGSLYFGCSSAYNDSVPVLIGSPEKASALPISLSFVRICREHLYSGKVIVSILRSVESSSLYLLETERKCKAGKAVPKKRRGK